MRACRLSFLHMLKFMKKDMMLLAAGVSPVLMGLAIRLGIPALEQLDDDRDRYRDDRHEVIRQMVGSLDGTEEFRSAGGRAAVDVRSDACDGGRYACHRDDRL